MNTARPAPQRVRARPWHTLAIVEPTGNQQQETSPPRRTTRWLVWRLALGVLGLAYVSAWAVASFLVGRPTDLDLFFWPSAALAVHGHPLLVYSVSAHGAYPNANGPLSLIPLTAVAALVQQLGWMDDAPRRGALILGFFSLFIVLLATEAVRAIEAARGRQLRAGWRLGAFGAIVLAPTLWQAVAGFGHVEQPLELWLILVAVRQLGRDRWVLSGLALGLAVLTRTTAVLYLIPMALLPLTAPRTALRSPLGRAIRLGATASLTVVVGIAPFYLADQDDVIHSLVMYRADLPIFGGSAWLLAVGTPWESLGRHLDGYLVLASVLVLSTGMLVLWRRGAGGNWASVFGLLAAVACCFPMLAKTVWAYYLLDPYVLASIWVLGGPLPPLARSALAIESMVRWAWRPLVPLMLSAAGIMADLSSSLPPHEHRRLVESVGTSAAMAVAIGLLLIGSRRSSLTAGEAGTQ